MRFKRNYLYNYLQNAPVALAVERSLECQIMAMFPFERPILDIGCGDGLFTDLLFDESIDTGVDFDQSEINQAKKKGVFEELICCSVDSIPKNNASYNTIYSNSTLEHVENLDQILSEIYRLLKDQGSFYLTVPTEKFEQYTCISRVLVALGLKSSSKQYRQLYNQFWKHKHCYKKEAWEVLFHAAGFEVVDSQEYADQNICLLNDLMLPFALPSIFTKKIFGRWVISRQLRKLFMLPFFLFVRKVILNYENGRNGGIVFFSLKKIITSNGI